MVLSSVLGVVESPRFPPLSKSEAKLKVEQTLSQKEVLLTLRSRWTLDLLMNACQSFIKVKSRGAFKRVLKSLKVSYQRARTYFHSPDLEYADKLAYIRQVISSYEVDKTVVLFQDEVTYYNHASPASDHCPEKQQPKAPLAIGGQKSWRISGALDIFSGQFISIQRQAIEVPTFIGFLKLIAQKYPEAEKIYIIMDNWPVHAHPDVIDALQTQNCPYPFVIPPSWKDLKASGKYKNENLQIQLVPLPTYASWLNPVEKIWRMLRQKLIHNHSFANNFKELKSKIDDFLIPLDSPCLDTLSAAGLLKADGIFADQFRAAGVKFPVLRC